MRRAKIADRQGEDGHQEHRAGDRPGREQRGQQPIRPSRSASLWSWRKGAQRSAAMPPRGVGPKEARTWRFARGVHRLTRGVVNFYLLEDGRPAHADRRRGRRGTGTCSPRGSPPIGQHRRGPRGRARHARAQRPHRVRRAGARSPGRASGFTRPTPRRPAARSRGRTRPASAGTSSSSSPTAPSAHLLRHRRRRGSFRSSSSRRFADGETRSTSPGVPAWHPRSGPHARA